MSYIACAMWTCGCLSVLFSPESLPPRLALSVPPAQCLFDKCLLSESVTHVDQLEATVTFRSWEMDYFCCFAGNNCSASPSHFMGKDPFPFAAIAAFGVVGRKQLFVHRRHEPCSHLRGLLLARILREVTRVLMGTGAPTQELSNFTGLCPRASFQAARSQLDTLCLSTAWLMPQLQARKPFSQG